MFGAGPTGLVLAQLLRQNGGCKVVLAAPGGLKMDLAKKLDAADIYIELSRDNPEAQFQQIKDEYKYGFDIVVEATGSAKILEDAINYVRRGGKLVVYGVYSSSARVTWPPSKIFGDEITILGSFSETYMFRKYSFILCAHILLLTIYSCCYRLPRLRQGQGWRYR